MTTLIGLAGRKQSGKGTCSSFLMRNAQKLWPEMDSDGWQVGYKVDIFPMAWPIKRFCVDVLGLTHEQVYGTDEQKNTLTRYRWEDLPHYDRVVREIAEPIDKDCFEEWYLEGKDKYLMELEAERRVEEARPKGAMTARQVMQQVGSSMRCWNKNVWVEACLYDIERSGASIAIIDDVRHPNEVEAILAAGGVVYRTTRCIYPQDTHESEVSLDQGRFDWSRFTGIIDNAPFGVRWTEMAFLGLLQRDGIVGKEVATDTLSWSPA